MAQNPLGFDWDDLKHLISVARHGSSLAAGRVLGVDQSTVQRRLGGQAGPRRLRRRRRAAAGSDPGRLRTGGDAGPRQLRPRQCLAAAGRRRRPGPVRRCRAARRGADAAPCTVPRPADGRRLTHAPAVEAPASFDGPALEGIRVLVGSAMAWFLGLGVAAVRRRDFASHQAWMVRAYALGLGAGTQALTHLPWFLWPDIQGVSARTLCMAAGWAINLTVAEWLIARARPTPGPTPA
jgi:hypothetical protein